MEAYINWFQKPEGTEVINFIDQEFDILIDLTIEYSYPLNYICTLSRSRFKVGMKEEGETKDYDMLIDISKKKTIEFIIIQVKHYIKLINEKNEF